METQTQIKTKEQIEQDWANYIQQFKEETNAWLKRTQLTTLLIDNKLEDLIYIKKTVNNILDRITSIEQNIKQQNIEQVKP
jgi:hypothetical protein